MINTNIDQHMQQDRSRYRHYYQQLSNFYQKPVAQVSSALLLTLFTIIFFAAFAIRPTLATISELIRKIDDQKKVLSDLKKKAAALNVVQSEYAIIADRLPLLDAAVPANDQVDQLLKMVEAVASLQNLPIASARADDIMVGTPSATKNTKTQTDTKISITIEGGYPQAREFINALLQIPRLITIDELQFAPTAKDNSEPSEGLRTTIVIHAYHTMPI